MNMNDFGMQDVYTLHIKRHRSGNTIISPNCESCQKGFVHVNTLQVRQFTQSGKLPGVCKSCNAQFLKICRVQIRSMNQNDNPSHVCDLCGKTFTHAGNFIKHKRLHEAATLANLKTMEIVKANIERLNAKSNESEVKEEKESTNAANEEALEIKNKKGDNQSEKQVTGNVKQSIENVKQDVENVKQSIENKKQNNGDNKQNVENIKQSIENKKQNIGNNKQNTENEKKNIEEEKQNIENEKQNVENEKLNVDEVKPNFISVSHKPNPPYTCDTCGKIFKTYGPYLNHCASHNESLVCPICEKACSSKAVFRNHTARCESRQPVYMCHYCEKCFNTKSSLKSHMDTHVVATETHVCKFCKETFIVAEELEQHLNEHVNGTNSNEEEKFDHFCVECGKGFNQLKRLKTHMLTHSGNLPYQCKTCRKQFVQSYNLLKHMQKTHGLNKPYSCKICSKMFKNPKSLKKHKALYKVSKNLKALHKAAIKSRKTALIKKDEDIKLEEENQSTM